MLKQGMVALGLFALVGCGGGDPLGEGDAQIAWEATQGAMGGPGAEPNAISSSVACPEGGNVKWKYDLGDAFSGLGSGDGTNVDVEYELVFKGCKNNGVKISGNMLYTIGVVANDEGSSTRWGYEGKLKYSGDIKGSCEYEMYGEASASAAGASVSYSGSICGNDASATLNVGADGTVTNNVDGEIDDGLPDEGV